MFLDICRLHGMTGCGDETTGAHADVAQDVGGRDHLATNDNLEAAAQLTVPAGDRLYASRIRVSW